MKVLFLEFTLSNTARNKGYFLLLLIVLLNPIVSFGNNSSSILKQASQLVDQQQYDSARSILLATLKNIQEEDELLYKIYELIGESYHTQSRYSEALNYYIKAERIANKIDNCYFNYKAILNKTRIKYGLNEKKEALRILKNIEEKVLDCKNDTLIHLMYYYQGVIEYEIGLEGAGDSVQIALTKSLKCCESWLGKDRLAVLYAVRGENRWVRLGEPQEGYKDFLLSKKYADESGDLNAMAFANIKLGGFSQSPKDFEQSEQFLTTALQQFDSLGSTIDIIYAKRMLALLYGKNNQAWKCYETYDDLWVLYDSVYKAEMRQEVAEYRTKYETKKKEEDNIQLTLANAQKDLAISEEKQRNQNLFILLMGILILTILSALVLYWRSKIKAQKEKAKKERLTFLAMSEGEEKERIRLAKDLHDGLGQLLSSARLNVNALENFIEKEDEKIFKNSLDLIDEAVQEVRNVSHALMPGVLIELGLLAAVQQLANKINDAGSLLINIHHVGLENRLSNSVEITLYRVIQEILNNMVKHANASIVDVRISKTNGNLTLSISDDGRGFNVEQLKHTKGIGWKNIRSRISLLNGYFSLDSKLGEGTNINIKLSHLEN